MQSHRTTLTKYRDKEGRYGCYTSEYHQLFQQSCWIVVRRFANKQLTEGDFAVAFSQFGEVVDVRCPRSKRTGDIAGHAVFVEFQQVNSAVLAADNMNSGRGSHGIKVFLTAACEAAGVGLEVDRCSAVEVPPITECGQTYGEWFQEQCTETRTSGS